MLVRRVGHVAEVQVEVAVVVEVGEQHAGAARRDGERFLGVQLELALLVAEEEVGLVAAGEQVGDGHGHLPSCEEHRGTARPRGVKRLSMRRRARLASPW